MAVRYCIKKIMEYNGKTQHVLLIDGDEVLEFKHKDEAEKLVSVLNNNTDSGWVYEIVPIGK
jgi:hypothetical protein